MIALAAALVRPSVDPAVEYVRALPWTPAILVLGEHVRSPWSRAAFALTRRHPGRGRRTRSRWPAGRSRSSSPRAAAARSPSVWPASPSLAGGAGAALVAGVARRPGPPRIAPGNEQRLLALAVIAVISVAVSIAVCAVDWPAWDGGRESPPRPRPSVARSGRPACSACSPAATG